MDLTRITGKSFGRALLLFADVAKRTTTVTRWCLTFFGSHLCSRTMSGQTICRVLVPALGLKVVVFNECSPPNPETWNHRLVQMGWQLSAKMSVTCYLLPAGCMNICLRTPNTTDIMLKTTGKICYKDNLCRQNLKLQKNSSVNPRIFPKNPWLTGFLEKMQD